MPLCFTILLPRLYPLPHCQRQSLLRPQLPKATYSPSLPDNVVPRVRLGFYALSLTWYDT